MINQEELLLQGARRFDEKALAEIYDSYNQELFRYAWRLLGDRDLAEDCVAETFSRFLTSLKNRGGPQQYLRAYLYRIAHNWITDHYRRSPPPSLELDVELRAGEEMEPHQIAQKHFEQQEMRAALRKLTPEQRQVVVLRYLQAWEIDEIAQALHKPVGAVKALQHRGVQALKRLLVREEEREYVETFADG